MKLLYFFLEKAKDTFKKPRVNKEKTKNFARSRKLRIDFRIDTVKVIDKEKGLFSMELVPDERVWKRTEVNGVSGYLNKRVR